MKIIMSPSKKQQSVSYIAQSGLTALLSPNKTHVLFERLQALSEQSLKEQLNIKGKILNDTYELYQRFSATDPRLKAIDLYKGAVFAQLSLPDYSAEEAAYMENHLCVLSAMYGLLEPSMGVWPYRLDMQSRLQDLNLYEYWQETVEGYFSSVDVIINLASVEFSKLLKNIEKKMFTVRFLEEQKDGSKKTAGIHAKKARGQMIHLMIKNKVCDTSEICEMSVADYEISESLTDEFQCTMLRPYRP